MKKVRNAAEPPIYLISIDEVIFVRIFYKLKMKMLFIHIKKLLIHMTVLLLNPSAL